MTSHEMRTNKSGLAQKHVHTQQLCESVGGVSRADVCAQPTQPRHHFAKVHLNTQPLKKRKEKSHIELKEEKNKQCKSE